MAVKPEGRSGTSAGGKFTWWPGENGFLGGRKSALKRGRAAGSLAGDS